MPDKPAAATSAFIPTALRYTLSLALRLLIALPFWPIYLLLRLLVSRPPLVAPWARWSWVMGKVWSPALQRSAQDRVILTLALLQRGVVAPLWGLAWTLDEVIYGRALDAVRVEAPIFEVSAARSGSTQLARYLEEDPRVCAPAVLRSVLPFLWVWALVPEGLLARIGPDRLTKILVGELPAEFVARHEVDVTRTDTFEVLVYSFHLGDLIHQLGARPFVEALGYGRLTDTNQAFWEQDFLPFMDRVGRKTLLSAGPGRRLLIKGHFLGVAEILEARYPDARFVTMVREPTQRIRSMINYLYVQPADPYFPPLPWSWVVERALCMEEAYCHDERAWLSRPEATRHSVVRFEDYVKDLQGTLARVYTEGLGMSPPEVLPEVHAHRARSGYTVDKTLPELDVDVAALKERLAAPIQWQLAPGSRLGEQVEHALLPGAHLGRARQGLGHHHADRAVAAEAIGQHRAEGVVREAGVGEVS